MRNMRDTSKRELEGSQENAVGSLRPDGAPKGERCENRVPGTRHGGDMSWGDRDQRREWLLFCGRLRGTRQGGGGRDTGHGNADVDTHGRSGTDDTGSVRGEKPQTQGGGPHGHQRDEVLLLLVPEGPDAEQNRGAPRPRRQEGTVAGPGHACRREDVISAPGPPPPQALGTLSPSQPSGPQGKPGCEGKGDSAPQGARRVPMGSPNLSPGDLGQVTPP